jgi:mannan polymerase II complex MNN10 subunit
MRWVCLFFCFHLSAVFASDIAVVSLAAGDQYREAVHLGIENKKQYCKQHGYDFICEETSLDTSRPIAWSKIKLIQKVMENPKYNWVFWTDADALIMNLAIPLEELIDERYDLIISKDFNNINTGHFLIKNSDWSQDFLKRVYSHVNCIHGPWWEQHAVIGELQDKYHAPFVKMIPQRFMNSYPFETARYLTGTYQRGDFVVHFAGVRGLDNLESLMSYYYSQVVSDKNITTLDTYLGMYGFQLSPLHSGVNEGYMTESQKKQFEAELANCPHIQSIAEIGLNGGHSAEHFFNCCPHLNHFVSFDLAYHNYTEAAVSYLSRKYGESFEFQKGDSIQTVPQYAADVPDAKFDLIYVDGNHTYEYCKRDILNCRALAHRQTILWIDDYGGYTIYQAVHDCVKEGIIEIDHVFPSNDPCGGRCWVKAHYVFN